jgi:hypothetical protein
VSVRALPGPSRITNTNGKSYCNYCGHCSRIQSPEQIPTTSINAFRLGHPAFTSTKSVAASNQVLSHQTQEANRPSNISDSMWLESYRRIRSTHPFHLFADLRVAVIHRCGEHPARWMLNTDYDALGILIRGSASPSNSMTSESRPKLAGDVRRPSVLIDVPKMLDHNSRLRNVCIYYTVYPLYLWSSYNHIMVKGQGIGGRSLLLRQANPPT